MTEKENLLRYVRREEYDHVPEGLHYIKTQDGETLTLVCGGRGLDASGLVQSIELPACEGPMFGEGYDVFGVHWSKTDGASHYTPGQTPIYDDIEDWGSQVRFPDIDKLDWETFRREAEKLDTENHLVSAVSMCGLFERATMLTTMENCLMDAISEPEHFADMLGAIADYKIALLRRACEYVRIDLLIYHDDWGTNVSTFMSPELWRATVKPHTARLYKALDELGITVIQHSCGVVLPLIDDVIEIGGRIMDLQQNRYDLKALSEKYGERMFFTVNNIGAPREDMGDAPELPPPPMKALYPAYAEKPEFLYS